MPRKRASSGMRSRAAREARAKRQARYKPTTIPADVDLTSPAHTLSARALVVAPDDELQVINDSSEDPVDVTTDGRTVCSLGPREEVEVRFKPDMAPLAQVAGASFYHRLRDKFGSLTK